jgi:phosphopantothenoylcysteine decarboxylase/phosphopantothenate--cysteine ligase
MQGRKILLGITGGIAAYKSASLIRLLKKQEAEVKVICTPEALDFVTPLTLSTLSQNPVYHQFADKDTGEWTNHVELGSWADLFLIAPCTANTLAKMVTGQADNLLLATYLSARCPVMIAPAMDVDMYHHPATQQNIKLLQERNHVILEPEEGFLASGLFGKGRMVEPEDIVQDIMHYFAERFRFSEHTVLITAGPTKEDIDPVRFISNHSSGKMGFAFAEQFANEGAKVILVKGPTSAPAPMHPNIEIHEVQSALQMLSICLEKHKSADICVFTAAVADYRPAQVSESKIKKESEKDITLQLVKNPDIAAELGLKKLAHQYHLGFALETENGETNALRKIKVKNFDAIVLNMVDSDNNPFGGDDNDVVYITNKGNKLALGRSSKHTIAQKVINLIYESLYA